MKKQQYSLHVKCSEETKAFVQRLSDELEVPESTIARWALEKYRKEHTQTPFLPTSPTYGTNQTEQDS